MICSATRITYRIAGGPRAGQKLFTLQTVAPRLQNYSFASQKRTFELSQKRTSQLSLYNLVARNQPYIASKLMGRAVCVANRAVGTPLRRAPGH